MSDLSKPMFKDETKARLWLESQIWPDGWPPSHYGLR